MGELDINKLSILKSKVIDYIKKIYYKQNEDTVNEELTKHWFILPFLEALGYDTHSSDVIPEVKADFSKKGEKVDYELQVNDVPVAIIECKKFLEPLEGHINQLYRYFPTLEIHIGILTNGIKYWFFTDSEKDNVMDKKPFLMIDIAEDDNFDCLRDYTRDNILNAPVPSIENKRKQAEKERQQLEEQKEQELSDAKTQVHDLQSQINDMQAMIEKYKANENTVAKMQDIIKALEFERDKANEKSQDLEQEIENIKSQETTIDEETYNAILVQQMINNDSIKTENEKLKKELKEAKKSKKEKVFYGNSDLDKQRVPDDIAKDMIDLLPESLFVPETKILDPFCRYGELLIAFKNRAMQEPAMIKAFPDEDDRDDYISDNMLYALVIDEMGLKNVTRVIHKTSNPKECHVVCFGNEEVYKTAMRSNSKIFIKEKLEELKLMKINAVIGNPPYNNDMYIPFVEMGHQLATDCSVFITPAKWQAKGDNAKDMPNERFRKTIVPYMSKIVMYKDSLDIFNIEEWGGISYYLISKDISNKHEVKSVCTSNSSFNNDYEEHDEDEIILYGRKLLTIIGKVGQLGEGFKQSLYVKNTDHGEKSIASQLGEGFKQSLYVKNTDHGEKSIASQLGFKRCVFVGEQDRGQQSIPNDYVEIMQGEKVSGYKKKSELFTQLNIDKWKCICSIMPGAVSKFDNNGKVLGMFKISIIKPNQVPKGSFPVLKYFDTENECKSFISYMECKLTAFLYYLGCCGTTLTKEFFRFIPDPVKYDHIFTDEELYKKYNLTDEEINIIESVIKERK